MEKLFVKNKRKIFAYDYLVPTQGKFFYFVISSTLGLFVITLAFFVVDYSWQISIKTLLTIFLFCLVFSLVIWSIAYGYVWLVRYLKDRK